jgi:long-chain acyl-CoA synthetase
MHGGGTLYFGGSPKDLVVDLRAARPTFFLGVPRIWEKLRQAAIGAFGAEVLESPGPETKRQVLEWLGLDALATAITGGAPMPPGLNAWYRALGLEVLEAYASSEVASAIVSTREHCRDGSVGRVLPNVQVRIADNGEILIRSETCMLGYYGQPEMTREALADGWMHTGDMGRLDEDGYLFITGRLKDIYKTAKGKYVAPLPIERKFAGNAYLEQVCLVGEGLVQPVLVAQQSAIAQSSDPSEIARHLGALLDEVNRTLEAHERIRFILLADREWNEANGLCTHSLKINRRNVEAAYSGLIAELYPAIERTGAKVHWQ